jgi:hypothetical protein
MATNTHKRGDTFSRTGAIEVYQNGVRLLNLTGWTGLCHLRDKADRLIANLGFTWVDATQSLARLDATAAVTKTWPVEELYTDIQMTSPAGVVVSTVTTAIAITKDQSRV